MCYKDRNEVQPGRVISRQTGIKTPGLKRLAVLLLLIAAMPSFALLDLSAWPPKHQKIILDQDMTADQDDVGALVLVHKFADAGVCDIIAMGISVPRSGPNYGAPKVILCMDAINTYYGRPDIPIGQVKRQPYGNFAAYAWLGSDGYSNGVAAQFPHKIDTANVPEACELYKQVLAQQPDTSVTIIVTGYPTNLAQLIATPQGMAIARQKVKMVVQMGGSNTCCCSGREGNLWVDAGASKAVADSFPRPIVYSGSEVGGQTGSGGGFRNAPDANPAKYVYSTTNFSRSSWDPSATLFALAGRGPASNPYFRIGGNLGYQTISLSDSSNKWVCTDAAGRTPQAFIYMISDNFNASDPNLARVLDSIYAVPPKCINCPTAAQEHPRAMPSAGSTKSIAFVSDKEVVVTGMSHGSLELFDELGRICGRATIIDGQATVGKITTPNARFYFYRLKQQEKSVACGKIFTR
jgi:hypothetical protein